jgi:hypothetical protein
MREAKILEKEESATVYLEDKERGSSRASLHIHDHSLRHVAYFAPASQLTAIMAGGWYGGWVNQKEAYLGD